MIFVVLLIAITSGVGAGIVFLGCAVDLLVSASGAVPGGSASFAVFLALLSVPLAAGLAGWYLDSFVSEGRYRGIVLFCPLSVVLALNLFFSSGMVTRYIELSLQMSTASLSVRAGILSTLLGGAFVTGSLSALVVMLVVLFFEAPARWFLSATSHSPAIPFAALRLLLVVSLVSATGALISGLFVQLLDPSVVLTGGTP